jgi:hypothetical protein
MRSGNILLIVLTLAIWLTWPFSLQAQADQSHVRPAPTPHRNGVSVSFPDYVQFTEYPGISLGIEYKHLFDQKIKCGFSIAVSRLLWAGTQETKEYYATGHRANISASLISLGVNYYPIGISGSVFELGLIGLAGNLERDDSYRPGKGSGPLYDSLASAFFFAPQLHAAILVHGRRNFLFSIYGDFGPIVLADKNSNGNYGVVGLKFGGWF